MEPGYHESLKSLHHKKYTLKCAKNPTRSPQLVIFEIKKHDGGLRLRKTPPSHCAKSRRTARKYLAFSCTTFCKISSWSFSAPW